MSFKESDLERLIIDLMTKNRYEYVHGDNLERNFEDVLLNEDIYTFLHNKYRDQEITDER